jgi:integrase
VSSPGKSASAVRSVDLDDVLLAILDRQRDLQRFEARSPDYLQSELVFTARGGASYHPMTLSSVLAKRSTAVGLPRLTAHGLRHTSATLMLASGVPPKVAAERLGHADPTLFTNLYSHVTPTMQREAAGKIGSALFGPSDGDLLVPGEGDPAELPLTPGPTG